MTEDELRSIVRRAVIARRFALSQGMRDLRFPKLDQAIQRARDEGWSDERLRTVLLGVDGIEPA